MNQWAFVFAAYAVAIAGVAVLLVQSLLAMRSAERATENLNRRASRPEGEEA